MIDSTKSDIIKIVEDILKNNDWEHNFNLFIDLDFKLKYLQYQGIDLTKLYEEIILSREELDLSKKMYFFKEFYYYEKPQTKKEIFFDIMSRFARESAVYNLKYPLTIFMLYKEYRDSDGTFDRYFNSFLELNDDVFYEIVTEKLSTIITTYTKKDKYLSIHDLSYTESFKEDLLYRIDQLDDNKRDHVKMLIKTAGKY